MSESVQIEIQLSKFSTAVVWLQGITLLWMLVECGISLYAAVTAHSPAMLAFGSDSFVELLSAGAYYQMKHKTDVNAYVGQLL